MPDYKREDEIRKALDHLKHIDHFQTLIEWLRQVREDEIKSLPGKDDGGIREISGRIQAFDALLTLFKS